MTHPVIRSRFLLATLVMAGLACAPGSTGSGGAPGGAPSASPVFPTPIDPQQIQDQDLMTWNDYHSIPGLEYTDTLKKGTIKNVRLAIITVDFPDYPFVLTLPKKSDLFGNPNQDPIKREEVPKYWYDFYANPKANNYGHTINEYWMEQSRGKIGVTVTTFGPYRMPNKMAAYSGYDAANLPTGITPGGNMNGQIDSLWRADKGANIRQDFDLVLRLVAGYDETATWQEFGEMKFQTREDITPAFGNPDPTKPKWVRSRYVPWTSWMAGVWLWSNSAIIQGECINSIRHEVSHAAFSIGDNYNNPYSPNPSRAPAGPWDLMDRGSFNGPGGPHKRYVLPPNEGGAMSSGLMLRQKLQFKFVDSSQVLFLNRDGLAKSGLATAEIVARAVTPPPGKLAGVSVRLDGDQPRDRTPNDPTNPYLGGTPNFAFYAMEVVQRLGYDSFTPDNGVLISKNKEIAGGGRGTGPAAAPAGGAGAAAGGGRAGGAGAGAAAGGRGAGAAAAPPVQYRTPAKPFGTANVESFGGFTWTIDANQNNINKLDFNRPNGEPVFRTIGDYRQLNDALFHAGTNSGGTFEWEDADNRLHFYIVDLHRDEQGIRSYTVAVRSLDGAGPQRRGVGLAAPTSATSLRGDQKQVAFALTNTGAAAPVPAGAHIQDVTQAVSSDVYRMKVTVEGAGWDAALPNALAAVKFGATQPVAVVVRPRSGAAASAIVTLTATSESDPTKMTTARYTVTR